MSVSLNVCFLLNQRVCTFHGFGQVKPCSSRLLWFGFRVVTCQMVGSFVQFQEAWTILTWFCMENYSVPGGNT